MELDDDLGGEDGVSRDGIDDFLEENYRRTAEREADNNFMRGSSGEGQGSFQNNVSLIIFLYSLFYARNNKNYIGCYIYVS